MHDLEFLTLQTKGFRGEVELIIDAQHLRRVVYQGMLQARTSLEIATANFKAMLVPAESGAGDRTAPSIVQWLIKLAQRGVEVRLLHAGVPSGPALQQLKGRDLPLPKNLTMRRCPRLHAKAVIVDSQAMYLGSANLTGAGLGAKSDDRRNFEMGIWTRTTPLIDAVLVQFNNLWEGRPCQTCQRRDVCPLPLEEPQL